jgi:hypothetical protein
MPLVDGSSYRAPWWLPGGQLQTIMPALLGRAGLGMERERLELEDGDFLDLDWWRAGRGRLVVLTHGLEADSGAVYVRRMAAALVEAGWDVLAWNLRGCGGEMNRLPVFYHSGASGDLFAVLSHALASHPAERIDLIGYSLGGNLTLKLLGERAGALPERVGRAVVFSVPCDLADSAKALSSRFNEALYVRRFLRSLAAKIRAKHRKFPGVIDPERLRGVTSLREFDERFTAPLHGFRDAEDYWARSSCRPLLDRIDRPCLLVNAANDPFLGPACYPREVAAGSAVFHLEVPETGGHVGFPGAGGGWMERRALEFLRS